MPLTDSRSSESRVPLSALALSKSAAENMAQEREDLVAALNHVKIDDRSSYTVVDTPAKIVNLVDALADLPVMPPSLYVDLEGVNLCRHGSISIIQIYVLPNDHTYLVDVHSLGEAAFSTRSHDKRTLREIMESSAVPKVFFDVRNDSDALYSHFGVGLNGVHDLQLMELATRRPPRGYVSGLRKCIQREVQMTAAELHTWKVTKEKGLNLFEPGRGGSYEVFNIRPLSDDILKYCIQDVRLLPKLWVAYYPKLMPIWAKRVELAVKDRIILVRMRRPGPAV